MNIRNLIGLPAALAALAIATTAQAGLVVIEEPTLPPLQVTMPVQTLQVTGTPPAMVETLKGDIANVDFTLALKTIVPADWKGFADSNSGIRDVGKVTVRAANRPWTEVLEDTLRASNFAAALNWDKKEITFKSGR